jgi:uncharacterized protein (TIGR02145 family)
MKIFKESVLFATICSLLLVFGFIKLNAQEVTDYEGNIYKTVKIGPHFWTTRNLDVSHFRNGDVIPEVKTDSAWKDAGLNGKPAWCYYGNDTVNGKKFGKLYNWYAVTDPRGLAPEGCRIPSTEDWRGVTTSFGGVDIAGAAVKSPAEWKIKDLATNKSGFSGLPAGIRDASGKFDNIKNKTHWWSSTPDKYSPQVFSLMVADTSPELLYIKMEKASGLSVRCIKEK